VPTLTVIPGDPEDPPVTALLHASHALMESLFPSEANNYLSIDALLAPNIRFFKGCMNEEPKGCGALKIDATYGELKSMFVAEDARGTGLADAILERLEEEARTHNLTLLKLETGTLLHAAHKLYARHGYRLCSHFGTYLDTEYSLYMEKDL